ncbi:hypothetical protein Hanom_Chr13g01198331 [Helianthus anomalus]
MGIRVLSGRSFIEVLAQILSLCNEDTIRITSDYDVIDLSGCDKWIATFKHTWARSHESLSGTKQSTSSNDNGYFCGL